MAHVNGGCCFDQSSRYNGYVVIAEGTHHQSPQKCALMTLISGQTSYSWLQRCKTLLVSLRLLQQKKKLNELHWETMFSEWRIRQHQEQKSGSTNTRMILEVERVTASGELIKTHSVEWWGFNSMESIRPVFFSFNTFGFNVPGLTKTHWFP